MSVICSRSILLTYPADVLTGPGVIAKVSELTKGDAIITTDVGQHQMWSAQYYTYRSPRTFLSSGGLGTDGLRRRRLHRCASSASG